MNNLEIYKTSINQIFACLDKLEQGLDVQEHSNNISNLKEYKESAVSFAKLIEVASTKPLENKDISNKRNEDMIW